MFRGIFNKKLNLSRKGYLGRKKSAKYEIPTEMNTVENYTQHLPFSRINRFFFFQTCR